MKAYIGITGLSGTGKDTVGNMLADLAETYGIRVYRYNLSDEIRDVLARRGIVGGSASRSMLIEVGNELRATYGGGTLADRIVMKDLEIRRIESCKPNLVIVTGIRNPGEVETFRREWGKRFKLVTVEASQEVRARRVASREQYQEDAGLSDEVEQADQAIGIIDCERMSDWHIRNEVSLNELKTAIQTFFERNMDIARMLGTGDAVS
jgi:dephospho-CoA kinase